MDMFIRCLQWHKDVLAQSVRLGSDEVASDDGRKRPKHVRKIVNCVAVTLKGDNIVIKLYSVTD
jgi:hypothetical protein